jgi:hypothetical protein
MSRVPVVAITTSLASGLVLELEVYAADPLL